MNRGPAASLKQVFNSSRRLGSARSGEHVRHPGGGQRQRAHAELANRSRIDPSGVADAHAQPAGDGFHRAHVGAPAERRQEPRRIDRGARRAG